jgi:SAM-dependent methyltransferase
MKTFHPFWEAVGRQLRCPVGRSGRLIGRLMSVANREPNRVAIEALQVAATDTVLELGFGPGQAISVLSALASRGQVLGIDRSPEMLAEARRRNRPAIAAGRVRLGLGGFDALPLEDASVDKILAVNVVYFFNRDGVEIREALRVLRPGGVMAVYATDRSSMSRWRFAGPDTHALFDAAGLQSLARAGGFPPDSLAIESVRMPFGIEGLLGVFRKAADGARIAQREIRSAASP